MVFFLLNATNVECFTLDDVWNTSNFPVCSGILLVSVSLVVVIILSSYLHLSSCSHKHCLFVHFLCPLCSFYKFELTFCNEQYYFDAFLIRFSLVSFLIFSSALEFRSVYIKSKNIFTFCYKVFMIFCNTVYTNFLKCFVQIGTKMMSRLLSLQLLTNIPIGIYMGSQNV